MTILLKQLFNLIKLLNSETGENQIAVGIALGMILGFAPVFSLQTVLVFIIIFFFRVQMGAAFTGAFFFAIVAFILDPLFHVVGMAFLEMGALKGLYTALYQLPIIPFTKFYNSIVMGSLILSLVLFPFTYIGAKILIVKYRLNVVSRFQNTKFFKALKATKFYKWYAKYDELYG